MPVKPAKRGDKYRLVEPGGRIARAKKKGGKKGRAVDGGGHSTRVAAARQARAVNRGNRGS